MDKHILYIILFFRQSLTRPTTLLLPYNYISLLGPSLLFTRTVKDEEQKFYSCSAYRDRKYCNFFQWADEEYTESKKNMWAKEIARNCPKIDHRKCFMKLNKIIQSPESQRAYCNRCSDLFLLNEDKFHNDHEVTKDISEYLMTHPSEVSKFIFNIFNIKI